MIKRLLGGHSELIYGILRIVTGFLFACHGAQKLFGWFGGFGGTPGATAPLFSLLGLAGVIEFFGGAMIALGVFVPLVAFIASGEMAVAYFMAHMPSNILPLRNRGDNVVLFCFLFLYFASRGCGALGLGIGDKT